MEARRLHRVVEGCRAKAHERWEVAEEEQILEVVVVTVVIAEAVRRH